jgi:pheromone shutdown protein TraB
MTTLCYYSRIDYPEELLIEEQNPQREMFMAEQIMSRCKTYKRILAVTGGYHTSALME